MPPMPIKTLYRQLRKAKQFANKAGETIQDSVLVQSWYNNIEVTGLFTKYLLRMAYVSPNR